MPGRSLSSSAGAAADHGDVLDLLGGERALFSPESTGASSVAVTATCSVSPATPSLMAVRLRFSPSRRTTPLVSTAGSPESSTFTVKVPAGTAAKTKLPLVGDVSRWSPDGSLMRVTVAPGSTASLESTTVPLSEPGRRRAGRQNSGRAPGRCDSHCAKQYLDRVHEHLPDIQIRPDSAGIGSPLELSVVQNRTGKSGSESRAWGSRVRHRWSDRPFPLRNGLV